jgi:hypothetical protein
VLYDHWWLKEICFRWGPESVPIGTPTPRVLSSNFSIAAVLAGSRFGADSNYLSGGASRDNGHAAQCR